MPFISNRDLRCGMGLPIKVFILGSCVSRDPFETADEIDFDVVAYYARSSFASLGAEPYLDEKILSGVTSNWQRRMVRADMEKSIFHAIENSIFDILLIDLIDERFNLTTFGSSVHTISTEYRRAFYSPNSYGFLRSDSERKDELWVKGLKKLSLFLKANHLDEKVVVNKVYWSTLCKKPREIFSKYSQDQIDNANKKLSWMYSEIKKEIPKVNFINYHDEELEIDRNHKWGLDPFHYTKKAFNRQNFELAKIAGIDYPYNFFEGPMERQSIGHESKIKFVEFYKQPINLQGGFLSIERAVHSQDDLLFLEDAVVQGGREVISVTRNSNHLIRMQEGGDYTEVDISGFCKRKIKNCHTLKNGNRILQTAEPCHTYMVDPDFKLMKKVSAGKRLWHGSNSVDSDASGTVMYSEYIATKEKSAQPLYVWCSHDFGETWHVAMEKMSSPAYGVGECRHFHTCFSDPDIAGRWYVTTGDVKRDNCFFYSDDNGRSWSKAEVKTIKPGGLIHDQFMDNVFRFTSSYFDGSDIVWPTDDSLGIGKAMLIRMDKNKLPDAEIRIEHVFDENLMRTVIGGEDGREVYLSEAKHNLGGLSLYVKDSEAIDVVRMPSVPNLSGEPSGGTISKASHRFINDTAFSLADVKLFGDGNPSLLRYQFKKAVVPIPDVRVPTKKEVAGRPLVFFHAQRTAGTTIKAAFQQEFGKENCLYQRTSDEFCDWKNLDGEVLSKYRIYAGHYNYAPKEMDCNPLIFSVIRDPIDRAISLYHYLKTRPEHKLHELAVNEDILTFYQKAVEIAPDYVSNTQTLRVSGAQSFQQAVPILKKEYFLLAPFDEIDKVFDVFIVLGLVSNSRKLEKKPPSNKFLANLDPEVVRYLVSINSEDMLLYEYSKASFKTFHDQCL